MKLHRENNFEVTICISILLVEEGIYLHFRKGSVFWGYLYLKILTKMWCWKIEITQVRLPISTSNNSLIIGGNLTKFGKLVEKGLKFNINGEFSGYFKKPVRKFRLLYIKRNFRNLVSTYNFTYSTLFKTMFKEGLMTKYTSQLLFKVTWEKGSIVSSIKSYIVCHFFCFQNLYLSKIISLDWKISPEKTAI